MPLADIKVVARSSQEVFVSVTSTPQLFNSRGEVVAWRIRLLIGMFAHREPVVGFPYRLSVSPFRIAFSVDLTGRGGNKIRLLSGPASIQWPNELKERGKKSTLSLKRFATTPVAAITSASLVYE